jgi:hypothetical protein
MPELVANRNCEVAKYSAPTIANVILQTFAPINCHTTIRFERILHSGKHGKVQAKRNNRGRDGEYKNITVILFAETLNRTDLASLQFYASHGRQGPLDLGWF